MKQLAVAIAVMAVATGAGHAATVARDALESADPELVVLVSCVGRKLVMGARVDEEVEAVEHVARHGHRAPGKVAVLEKRRVTERSQLLSRQRDRRIAGSGNDTRR